METGNERVEAIAAATARDRALIAALGGVAMDRPGDQLAALLEAARTLEAASIPYALIGGIAVGIYTSPRATADVDVAAPTRVPRQELVSRLIAAGFTLSGEHEHSLNFRHPGGEPVQVAFDPEFDVMIDRAESLDVSGVTIRIVRREDLIAMKERAASDPARRKSKALRDRADVELLRGDVEGPDEGW